MANIRICLVDDSIVIHTLLQMLVARQPQFDLCGMAQDAEEALEEIDRCLPDIILLDLDLPGISGLDLLETIQSHWHPMNTIIVSGATSQGASICQTALQRGAVACFDKARLISQYDELVDLIHEAAARPAPLSHLRSNRAPLLQAQPHAN